MSLQDVTTKISDGQLSNQDDQGDGVHVKIGVSPIVSSSPIVITGRMTASRIRTLLGYSPLADAVLDSVDNGAARILCIPVAASTDGTISAVTKTGTGGGNCTASGKPYNAFSILVEFTGAGGFNAATFIYSIDGGTNYSDDVTLGLTGVFEIPNIGVTLTFTQGATPAESFKVGDVYALTTTAPKMTNNDVLTAIDTLPYITETFENVHIVGSSQVALWTAVSTAQKDLYDNYHKSMFFVLEAYEKQDGETLEQYVTGLEAAKRSVNNTDIQVVAARMLYVKMDGSTQDVNCAGLVCGLYAKAPVQRSIGRTSEFPLSEDKVLELRPSGIEPYIERLDTAQYLTLRRYDGLSGFYVTNARMMCPSGSDFKYADDVRVRNKAIRKTRKQALLQLQSDIDMANLDASLETVAKFIETPLDEMATAKEISAGAITIPTGQDILATEELQLTIRYVPIGKVRSITLDIGVKKSI